MSETYVLDGSAVLCLLHEERGAERVARALTAAVIGAVNYSEVVGKLVSWGSTRRRPMASLAHSN